MCYLTLTEHPLLWLKKARGHPFSLLRKALTAKIPHRQQPNKTNDVALDVKGSGDSRAQGIGFCLSDHSKTSRSKWIIVRTEKGEERNTSFLLKPQLIHCCEL